MKRSIIGRKLGMTQIFNEAGLMVPVTVVAAGPMTVVRKKTAERDGYEALVCAFEDVPERKLNSPQMGVYKKAKVAPKRMLKEINLPIADYEIGASIGCDIFNNGDRVDVAGMTKGHGFSGTIKRWNHQRLKMTHGTGPVHRERGSCGMRSDPGRVMKGLHMAGQYGHEQVTIQNLQIVRVDRERNVILIMGGLPGAKGSLITVKETVKS